MLYAAKLSQDFAATLQNEGVFVTGFYYPVVPKGQARIRVQVSAGHTTVLRSDARLGNATIREKSLLERVSHAPDEPPMDSVKLRLILRILTEMGVCRADGPIDGYYTFEVNFSAPKTSIEASPLLLRLRAQLAAGEA